MGRVSAREVELVGGDRRMGSASVFKSLQELFPQVDVRILRALSIEHEDDVNEAVEFILSDVLLSESTTTEFSSVIEGTSNQEQVFIDEDKGVEHISVPDDKLNTSPVWLNCVEETENRELPFLVADDTEDSVIQRSEQRIEASDNNNLRLNLSHLPENVDETLFDNADNQQYYFEVLLNGGHDDSILTEHHAKFSEGQEFANTALQSDSEQVHQVRNQESISVHFTEQTVSSAVCDNSGNPINNESENEDEFSIQLDACDGLSGCPTDACEPLNLIDLETVVGSPPSYASMLSMPVVSENEQNYQNSIAEEYKDVNVYENQSIVSTYENFLEPLSDKNEDYSILLTSLATRSGHAVGTDLLEDSIMDAKNSKKTLATTLESMVSMVQEVELFEEKAKQVKEDNLVDNHQILSKVEELKKILKQSNEEKDMHAGEVYGERSILAAEARELQSRLLKISEERNEYLSITEEIFRALETRKAAAHDEITAANLEKQEKEELVQIALKDHELLMDSIHAESRKLQQEAEENNKLREFLMDRGHVVDSLQGEIAVICEDILALKQIVDSHTPLTKYLRSSRSSASSAKSFDHRPLNSSNHILLSSSSSSSSSTSSLIYKESPEKHLQVENTSVGRNSLEDWELCEE